MDNQKNSLPGQTAGLDSGVGQDRPIKNSLGTGNSSPISALLSRLDKVRNAGRDQWLACCPAHDDRNPSLSVRELPDGRILLHCFSGCGAAEVLGAIGLTLGDLFPDDDRGEYRKVPPGRRWDYRGLLRALRFETVLVMTCANDLSRNCPLTADDLARLKKSAHRLYRIVEVAGE